MTDLIVPRGDTFPRSFLDTYRASRTSTELYNDLSSSKSDELVLQNPADIPAITSSEIHHGHSENLLESAGCVSPTEGDFLDKPEVAVLQPRGSHHRRRVSVYDRVDPEDSIRDIVTENDFYRFVCQQLITSLAKYTRTRYFTYAINIILILYYFFLFF